jgi:hypothetical protein
MGIPLSFLSNRHYRRNLVTGYFSDAQYQRVPNLKTVFSVDACGKLGT